jgi:NTE family protein
MGVACAALALVSTFAIAQPAASPAAQAANARPRIGLVLGGGGARGIAHIGVLKVLEEMRIPVDCIAGTSMGSIVGGVYAAGMPPGEMEKRVLAINWDDVFDDRIRRESLTLRRKDDERTPLLRPEFGYRDGAVQLPTGAITGRKLDLLLRDLTSSVPGSTPFDKLAIPYRAIATDLESGDMVVFDKGFLSQAMRASMSVPGAFDPVDVDGRLLVDGGLVRNVPVDIVRDMCADVVIAVDVGALNRKRDTLVSLPAVLDQMVNISIRRNADESLATLKAGDVKIVPDLGDIGSVSFSRGREAIDIGEKAAREAAPELARLSIPPAEYENWKTARAIKREEESRPIGKIELVGTDRVNPEVLRRQMQTQPGDVLDPTKLSEDLERLNARGDFEAIDFRTMSDDGQDTALRIKFTEKRWGPDFFRFGLNLSSDFAGQSYFNLMARYTRPWINSLGGELRGEVSVGRLRRLYGELYQPLNLDSTLYVRPYAGIQANAISLFVNGNQVAEYDDKATFAGFDLGSQIFKWGDVSVGMRYADSKLTPIISPRFVEAPTPYGGFTFRAVYDQLDNFFFPTRGGYVLASGLAAKTWLGSSESTQVVQATALKAFSFGPHVFNVGGEIGKVFGAQPETIQNLQLGGIFRLSGLKTEQLRGTDLILGRILYSYRVAKLPALLGGGVYLGGTLEAGNVWTLNQTPSAGDLIYAGSLFLGADTFAGPLYLAYGRASGNNNAFYFYLGRPF